MAFSDLTFSVILHAPSSLIIAYDKNFCSDGCISQLWSKVAKLELLTID